MTQFTRWLGARRLWLAFGLLAGIMVVFLALPLLKMVLGVVPGVLHDTALDSEVVQAIWLTIYAALIATAIGCLLGVPLAYLLARLEFPGKRMLESLIDLPIVVPHTAAGIALLFCLWPQLPDWPCVRQIGCRIRRFDGGYRGRHAFCQRSLFD